MVEVVHSIRFETNSGTEEYEVVFSDETHGQALQLLKRLRQQNGL